MNTKTNSFFRNIIAGTLLCAITTCSAMHNEPLQQLEQIQENPVSKQHSLEKLYTPLIIASLVSIFLLTVPKETRDAFFAQCSPKTLFSNFLNEYGSWSLSTILHEVGHTATAVALGANETSTHFGATGANTSEPLFSAGKFHLNGLNPIHGHTNVRWISEEKKTEKLHEAIRAYARNNNVTGESIRTNPAGFLESQEHSIYKKSLHPSNTKMALFFLAGGLTSIASRQLINGLRPDAITINQFLNSFVPIHATSDGARVWRDCAGVSPDIIDAIVKIALFLEISGELYCALTDTNSSPNAPVHSKLLLGLINYFTRGYLRFHA